MRPGDRVRKAGAVDWVGWKLSGSEKGINFNSQLQLLNSNF
jgi:hypothetical protein